MIWSLAREQMRAQRAYLVWSAALIALAVGFASYGALITQTVRDAEAVLGHAVGLDTEWAGYTNVAMASDAESDAPTWAELTAALDGALADGTRVVAYADIIELDLAGGWATSFRGDVDWDALLVEGSAPEPGEVVLPVDDATELGVSVGDVIEVRQRNGVAGSPALLTVAGLAHVGAQASGVSVTSPLSGPIVAWDDVPELWQLAAAGREELFASAAGAGVHWDGSAPAIERVLDDVSPGYGADSESVSSVLWAILGLVAVVLGVVAMAFAVGRAQAQSRSAWVATARALGATRKQVVGSTLLEAVVVGALGGAAGYFLGAAATTVHLQLIHGAAPGVALPSAVTIVPWVLLGALGLGLLLATVIAGVPAFWSARVQPVVALKPETDITAAEVSRRVRFTPVVISWVVAGVVLVLVSLMTPTTAPGVVLVASLVVFLVLTPVVANETLRWLLPPLGRWLSRRPEPAAIAAGDSVTARPRQLTVPGFVLALAMSVLIIVGSQAVFSDYVALVNEYSNDEYAVEPIPTVPPWAFGAAVALVAVAVLIGVAISIITHNVTHAERATREALGITPSQTRAAAGLAHGFAVGLGGVVGWGIGIVVGAAIAFAANDTSLNGIPLDVAWLAAAGFSAATGLLLIALAGAALGGIVVGLSARAKVFT